MHKVLVTGANGFIGRSLCERIRTEGWQVVGAVRTLPPAGHQPAGIDLFQVDSLGPEVDWDIALNKIDTVVHLAARTHVLKETVADPLEVYRNVNVIGTEHLAQVAATKGVRRFIYVSSIKVNGEERSTAYTEEDHPDPKDPYSISKLEAEQVLHKIADKTGLEVVILRPPLVYGPGVKANFLQLINIVNRGILLPLARVDNQRSLIFLENLVDALQACITHPKAAGKTFLLSDGKDVSTTQLIQMISSALGKPSRLFPLPPDLLRFLGKMTGRSNTVSRLLDTLIVNMDKIRQELNWVPPHSMEQGLRETAKWYMQSKLSLN